MLVNLELNKRVNTQKITEIESVVSKLITERKSKNNQNTKLVTFKII